MRTAPGLPHLMQSHLGPGQVFGGIDTTTALFYSAGATGVDRRQSAKDPNQKKLWRYFFLEDPSNFVTDEFQNQYGLGRIKAQYAYARIQGQVCWSL